MYFKVTLNGRVIYCGYVSNDKVDLTKPVVKLLPFSRRFDRVLYSCSNAVLSNHYFVKPLETIQEMITQTEAITKIGYDPALIELPALMAPITAPSKNVTVKEMLEDIQKEAPTYYWGVNFDNKLFFKPYQSSGQSERILLSEYQDIEAGGEQPKNNPTRQMVYKKLYLYTDAGNDVYTAEPVFIGKVGYPDSPSLYPQLPIELKTGPIEGVETVPEILYSFFDANRAEIPNPDFDQAMHYAYESIKKEATLYNQVTLKGIRYMKKMPVINRYYEIEGYPKKEFVFQDFTRSLTGWENASIITVNNAFNDDLNRGNKIYFDAETPYYKYVRITGGTGKYQNLVYENLLMLDFYQQEGVSLAFRTKYAQTKLDVFFIGDEIFEEKIVSSSNKWETHFFAIQFPFHSIVFNTPESTENLDIDNIQILCMNRSIYTERAKKINYEFEAADVNVDADFGEISRKESDKLLRLEKVIRQNEMIRR
jgi:hypothetical protein